MQDFDMSFWETSAKPSLHTKAAESGCLLRWSVWLAEKHRAILPGADDLLACGNALLQYLSITREQRGALSVARRQALTDCCIAFNVSRPRAGVHFLPKMHAFMHLVAEAGFLGTRWTPRIGWMREIFVGLRTSGGGRTPWSGTNGS